MQKNIHALTIALLFLAPSVLSEDFVHYVPEYSELSESEYSYNRDLNISNNFNLTGIMSLSGNGVDFLDINGVTQNATVLSSKAVCLLRNSGAAATLTLTLPSAESLSNGQILFISSNDANLTVNLIPGLGTLFGSSVTTSPSSRGIILTYRQADTTWYQLT